MRADTAVEKARERQRIVEQAIAIIADGGDVKTAARKLLQSTATIQRWLDRYQEEGFTGLLDKSTAAGRRSEAEKLRASCGPEEYEHLITKVKAANYDYVSNSLSWRKTARELPDGHPARAYMEKVVHEHTSKHSIAKSLLTETTVSKAQRLTHQGPRARKLGCVSTPRKLDILPGDMYCMDDETDNVICAVPCPVSAKYPCGYKAMQLQVFPCLDIASQYVGAFFFVARERSSYRGTDLWSGIGHCIDVMRLPRLGFQFERGTWESKVLRGVEVAYDPQEPSATQRIGGLQTLPSRVLPWHIENTAKGKFLPPTIKIYTSYTPKTKSIESWFNRSQRLRQAFYGYAGRDQRKAPQERVVKLFDACKRGTENPIEHFYHIDDILAAYTKSVEDMNLDPVQGEVFNGVPGDLWNEWTTKPGYEQLRIHPEMAWMYKSMWAMGKVKGPYVKVRIINELTRKTDVIYWENPTELDRFDGRQVAVYWDRNRLDQPAYIVDPATNTFHCEAQPCQPVGMFLDDSTDGYETVKAWEQFQTIRYGSIKSHIASLQKPECITERSRTIQSPVDEANAIIKSIKLPRKDTAAEQKAEALRRLEESAPFIEQSIKRGDILIPA
jgi:hypothetical protein